ncbi:hypothetical protein APA_3589 [Pseudanabaena sp. lw0831]|uniref:hypothetical protein n=1 Tax=Pseudanabaena sp. lw0831 TaxID=1357935 RepID=UPI001915EC35|nr:hypothetical protein [Pseudanabaena sp. lw0831]GBO55438.1 hypothetical protein APA_3589 [Pseudanabaena sp. lw0831]
MLSLTSLQKPNCDRFTQISNISLLHLTLRSLELSDRAKHRQVWDFAKLHLG